MTPQQRYVHSLRTRNVTELNNVDIQTVNYFMSNRLVAFPSVSWETEDVRGISVSIKIFIKIISLKLAIASRSLVTAKSKTVVALIQP